MHTPSGPVIALALERENAVKAWRDLMGPTNSMKVCYHSVSL
jgi:nucleoside diphosphate kinase